MSVTFDSLTHSLYLWVTCYLSLFSLVSIACWAGAVYLWGQEWPRRVRDALFYLLMIGGLTLILALKPVHSDALLWSPLTWFSFTLLMVMESLWLAYLLEAIFLYFRSVLVPTLPLPRKHSGQPPTHYHFPSI